MAQKRMFDKRVISTDKFADLPNSTKALYFIAGMDADDKGFFQPRKIQRTHGFSDDDYKILIAKGFFIVFDSGIMVITDWNKNNWLDSRRTQATEYIEELKLLDIINEKYELRDVAKQMLSQNRIEENSIEEYITTTNISNIFNYIEENYGRMLSPIEYEKINSWLLLFSEDIIKYAIEIAVNNGKKTISYLDGILKNWKGHNYQSLEEIKENESKKGKPQKEIPEWFDKNIENEVNIEATKEMDNLLEKFN